MVEATEEKLRRLEDEKANMSIIEGGGDGRAVTRKLRSRSSQRADLHTVMAGSSYRKRMNPPQISYALKDHEIYEDLQTIQTRVS